MIFTHLAIQCYFNNHSYYINQTCKQYNITPNKLKEYIIDYCLNNPSQWVQSLKKHQFINSLDQIDINKLKEFLDKHKTDSAMNFEYYILLYIYVYDNNINDLYEVAINKKLDKKKSVCLLGKYTKDDRYFDLVYKAINVKKVNQDKLKSIDKRILKDILVQKKPITEIEFYNLLKEHNVDVDFEFNFKNISLSHSFMLYLFNRMFDDKDYEYDLQTLKLIEKYILNKIEPNNVLDSCYRFLLIAFVHIVLIKYKSSAEMITILHRLQMQFKLINTYLCNDLFNNVTNNEPRKIYRCKSDNSFVFLVLYNDNSYKKYYVERKEGSYFVFIRNIVYDTLDYNYNLTSLYEDYKQTAYENTYKYTIDGWKTEREQDNLMPYVKTKELIAPQYLYKEISPNP